MENPHRKSACLRRTVIPGLLRMSIAESGMYGNVGFFLAVERQEAAGGGYLWCLGTDWQQTALLLHFLASPVSIGAYAMSDEPHHSFHPELPANLAWGEAGSVLFFTARTSVYRLQTRTRGTLLG